MSSKDTNAAVFRVHKNKGFTVMSNEHLLFSKPPMSLKAKGLLSMFLALPDDWNYSINGIVSICKESRDCIRSTLEELKNHGYLAVEKVNGKGGQFVYVYNIFEISKNTQPDTENPYMVNPILEHPIQEDPMMENPIQQNTKEQKTEEQNTKEQTFDAQALFDLYKKVCVSYPQPRELSLERQKKAKRRIEKKNNLDYWQTVFEKAEASSFCQKNKFISFDWFVQNDTNSQKVFEGNYDDKYPVKAPSNYSSGKYANYHSRQEEQF